MSKCKICGETVRGGEWPNAALNMTRHLAKNHPGWKKGKAKGKRIEKSEGGFCPHCGKRL